jgi:hypothetical protein
MVLGGQQGEGQDHVSQLNEECTACHFHSTCRLAMSAALNNLLLLVMNDDGHTNSADQETTSFCHEFYQITARWYKEEMNHEDHIEARSRDRHQSQQQQPFSSVVHTSFTRHCREWREIFFQNAVMMQLRRFGIFCRPLTAAAA